MPLAPSLLGLQKYRYYFGQTQNISRGLLVALVSVVVNVTIELLGLLARALEDGNFRPVSVCTAVLRSMTRLSLYLLMDHMNSNTVNPPAITPGEILALVSGRRSLDKRLMFLRVIPVELAHWVK